MGESIRPTPPNPAGCASTGAYEGEASAKLEASEGCGSGCRLDGSKAVEFLVAVRAHHTSTARMAN